MALRIKDLTGQSFGLWAVVSYSHQTEEKRAVFACRCECGTEKCIEGRNLTAGKTRSCGCVRPAAMKAAGLRRIRDLSDQQFGAWRVLRLSHINEIRRIAYFICQCTCGTVRAVSGDKLRLGRSISCGCFGRHGACRKTHAHSMSGAYRSWAMMQQRCYNEKATGYKNYGGRGISVCERWRESFANFLADMGDRPEGLSLDRYPDNDGNYEPANCRWATRKQQQNNRRRRRGQ